MTMSHKSNYWKKATYYYASYCPFHLYAICFISLMTIPVPDMTYNVFGGALNLALSLSILTTISATATY